MTEFEQGVMYAAGVLLHLHDEPTMAATIIREAGLGDADCSELDDFDKINLRKVRNEKGMALLGL